MIIPYSTDAPMYHWPFATIGLVVVNVVGFVAQIIWWEQSEAFELVMGQLNPLQWVTSIFMHADPVHLIGNMVFLLIFGTVVEGKIGLWFLPIYLAIGISESAVSQIAGLVLGGGPMLGASAAVMGAVAIGSMWAPKSNVQFFWLIYLRPYYFEVPLLMTAMIYVALDLFVVLLSGLQLSGAASHLMGAAMGAAIGLAMIHFRLVDCEDEDVITFVTGRVRSSEIVAEDAEATDQLLIEQSRPQVTQFLSAGNVDAALRLFEKLQQVQPSLTLTPQEAQAAVHLLQQNGQVYRAHQLKQQYGLR